MDSGTIISIFLFLLLLAALAAIGLLGYVLLDTKKKLDRYKGIMDLEAAQAKIKAKNDALQAAQTQLQNEETRIREAIAQANSQLSSLEGELDIQAHGLYQPKYDFGSSRLYELEIEKIRQAQKEMIRKKEAVVAGTEWTVAGSKVQGRKMVEEQTKLMLRAFNGECDSLILKVKYSNLAQIEDRIKSVYDAVNKLGKTQNCWISQGYFNLKLEELHLVYGYQEKLHFEQEEQRAIREQMREEERARRELEKAQQDAEKEEKRYQQALEAARKEMEQATGAKHDKLQAEIEELQRRLQEAEEKRQRAISQAQMTRSGHVYVISNIGSFGENVYKIGMTRRLEPEERIQELGDASVPFPFDVHALIYSTDAPSLEYKLHSCFDARRVNLINPRKEFFRVTLDEIRQVVVQNHGEIEFTLVAEAEEYRKTQAIIASGDGKGREVVVTEPIFTRSLN